MSERRAAGALQMEPEAAGVTAMRALASIKPIPTWLDARLTYAHKNLNRMKLKDNTQAIASAQRELTRRQQQAGVLSHKIGDAVALRGRKDISPERQRATRDAT